MKNFCWVLILKLKFWISTAHRNTSTSNHSSGFTPSPEAIGAHRASGRWIDDLTVRSSILRPQFHPVLPVSLLES